MICQCGRKERPSRRPCNLCVKERAGARYIAKRAEILAYYRSPQGRLVNYRHSLQRRIRLAESEARRDVLTGLLEKVEEKIEGMQGEK